MDAEDWVTRWSAHYPDRDAEDRLLRPLRGAECFGREQVERLVDWKFRADPRRRRRTRDLLASEDDERIEALTRQAFACFHDQVALLAVDALAGLGPATASLLLTARAPDRYTVIDSRTLASLRVLGRLPDGGHFDVARDWEPYLRACRELAEETGSDLRTVDRALVAAAGPGDGVRSTVDAPPADR